MFPESGSGFDRGAAAVNKLGRENLRAESKEEAENNQDNTDKAELKEEANGLILDDFFGGGNVGDGTIFVKRSAGATESNAEKYTMTVIFYHRIRGAVVIEKWVVVWAVVPNAGCSEIGARGGKPSFEGGSIET